MSDDEFMNQPMLTCIGNKRKLVSHIEKVAWTVKTELKVASLKTFDAFAGASSSLSSLHYALTPLSVGSTVVSRMLVSHSHTLHTNDLELYSATMAKCFLMKPTPEQQIAIRGHIQSMNVLAQDGPFTEGFISRMYAPKVTKAVQLGERCFYTRENALVIDTLRQYIQRKIINTPDAELLDYCLAPLLVKASIHANTAGVFKGFYKNKEGVGCFGGSGKNALQRILKPIRLDMPVWSSSSPAVTVHNLEAAAALASTARDDFDLIYLDPPYNQHPYGSNYFMLNLIALYEEPTEVSDVSGIPVQWNKSDYNYAAKAKSAMSDLLSVATRKSKFVLVSYNNEGTIDDTTWRGMLSLFNVKKYEIVYDTFKGSRNLKERDNKVVEIMYLVTSSGPYACMSTTKLGKRSAPADTCEQSIKIKQLEPPKPMPKEQFMSMFKRA